MGEKAVITIERMKKEDLDQVLAIEQESFTQPWSKNLFLSEFRSPTVSTLLVALAGDPRARTVAGYLIFWNVGDEMHILNLAVGGRHRRQGIGRSLVLSGLQRAHTNGARRAFLEVRASNTGAQKLYSALGFTGSFIRRHYYDTPLEDAVVMVLEERAFQTLVNPEK